MFNKNGFRKESLVNAKQILIAPENAVSVGAIVSPATTALRNDKGIIEAGTPVNIDYLDHDAMVKAVDLESDPKVPCNGVILHDVEVGLDASGDPQNATVVIFGFINENKITASVATKLKAALADSSSTKLITLLKRD